MKKDTSITRQRILKSAQRHFSHSGYAATSVQEIVESAKVTKPALYYYFGSKAGLFQALLDMAQDERLRVIQEGVARGKGIRSQLTEVLSGLFDYSRKHREVMRLAYSAAFAAPGELPPEIKRLEKAKRNFDFLIQVMAHAQETGEISKRVTAEEFTRAFYGLMNVYVMSEVVEPGDWLTRDRAKEVVEMFMNGAGKV